MPFREDTSLEDALVVTHYDLDGFVSALCLVDAFDLPKNRVRFLSYGVDREKIIQQALEETQAETLYICDIGLSEEDADSSWMRDPLLHRVLFDHHESTNSLDTSGFQEVYVDTSGNYCAADLVYSYLERVVQSRITPRLEKWVALAHDRDLWLNQQRNSGRRVTWLLKEKIFDRLDLALETASPEEFIRASGGRWKRGEALFLDAVECAKNTMYLFDDAPVPIKIAYVKRDTSDVADELQDGGQLVALLNIFGTDVGISFRTDRDELDVSDIAKRVFNGGGHRKAASGFLATEHLVGGFRAIRDAIEPVLIEQLAAHAR
ncbi:MAG: hypothetical protein O3A46_14295 [Candidatus Poribacteria bacterium]|nr:hypothetical protein [Candidatus Poribacteria bacterium]